MAPVQNETDEMNPNVPKSLCEMSNHLSCVNSVRWSVDGKWLASGGDDALVMIWQIKYQGISKSSFGGSNHEQWGCVSMLRGHNGDILGLAWSYDQKYLASCSVDNTIIIWNARDLPQKIASISGHEGLVKGLTWDPVGKYMASQSDDRSVRIWRTNDWKEVKQVKEPFAKCGGTTHVLRLSWSPDGKFIVTAHALNNDGPTAQIIERGDWKTGIDFVGHRKAVEVVSFNPHLFVKKEGLENHGCIALGSRDRSLSVWLTNLKRPLVVLHDLFTDSILDLSWSKSGYELLVCSTDGSVAYLRFSKKELGVNVSEQALDDIFLATYGSRRAGNRSESNSGTVLIEDPEMLKLVSQKESTLKLHVDPTSNLVDVKGSPKLDKSVEMTSTSSTIPSVSKQVETKTSDGRRRITPITLATQPSSLSGAPLPFTSFSPKQSKGVVVEPHPPDHSDRSSNSSQKRVEVFSSIKSPPPKPIHFEPLSPQNSRKEAEKTKAPEVAPPSKTAPLKRSLEAAATLLPKSKKLKRTKAATSVTAESSKMVTPQKASSSSKQVMLSIPELEDVITLVISPGLHNRDSMIVEIDNNLATSRHLITCRRNDSVLWSTSLASPALLASGNHLVTCVICNDKAMHIFSTQTGRLLLAKFYLASLPHTLKTESGYIMVVGSNANVSVWDAQLLQATIKEVSMAHLLQDGKKLLELESVTLTANGVPVITIKGITYMYHRDMGGWVEACSSQEQSEIHHSSFAMPVDTSATLRQLQKSVGTTKTRSDSVGQMLSSLRNTPSQASTLAYLESQVSRSLCLESPLEYTHWCTAYVRYLVKEGLESRLREFCVKFTTPVQCGGTEERVLGVAKQSLLRDLLAIIAGNTQLQRLYCELRDSLER